MGIAMGVASGSVGFVVHHGENQTPERGGACNVSEHVRVEHHETLTTVHPI